MSSIVLNIMQMKELQSNLHPVLGGNSDKHKLAGMITTITFCLQHLVFSEKHLLQMALVSLF